MSSDLGLKHKFIDFLLESQALLFGDFTTKSGRKTPYFINTGKFTSGRAIARLGEFYAEHAIANSLADCNVIFGPAYKGIPLAVTTAICLGRDFGKSIEYCFDRKETKLHGDGGQLVGHQLTDGDRVLIVEDVITAGTTLNQIVPTVRAYGQIDIIGVIVAVDRCERGTGELSAVDQVAQSLGISISAVVTIYDILEYLSSGKSSVRTLNLAEQTAIKNYLKQYGAH